MRKNSRDRDHGNAEAPVAIVGMSCRFAGCASPAALWETVMTRRCHLTAPDTAVDRAIGGEPLFENRTFPARIGQLNELYACVPSMQTFPPQVNAGENQDLYFATQLAFDALADAGLKPHPREPVAGSIHFGYAPPFNASTMNWLEHTEFLEQTLGVLRRFFPNLAETHVKSVHEKLRASLPEKKAASFLLGSGYRFISWIARECGFSGTAATADAGMLSGAVSVMSAVDDLRTGRADVALAGALTPPFSRAFLEGLAGEVNFSKSTELLPFSADSDGTLPGEGGAFFVLKRREDALRDNDRVYALVRTVAVGRATAEDPAAILRTVLERTESPAKSVGLIEADGGGDPVAEKREVAAIQSVWGEHSPGGALVGVGSVKGNVGHTLWASMAAGLVKAALALDRRVLPPQVEVEHPLDTLANITSSAYLLTEARPWISGDPGRPRRAIVLGANFEPAATVGNAAAGGRQAAILLEEERESRP